MCGSQRVSGRLQAKAFINKCLHVICHLTAVSGLCVCVCVCVWRWDTSHCSWRYVPLCPCRVAGRALRMVYVTLAGAFSPVRVSVPSLLSLSLSSDWLPPCMLLLNTTMTSLPTDLLRPMYEWESERYKERESWREKLAQCLLLCGLRWKWCTGLWMYAY